MLLALDELSLMSPVSTGCCIGEAQEVAETGRACQPQRSMRREGRVQKSRDNFPGAGDTQVSSTGGWRLFILCPCLHPLVSVWVGLKEDWSALLRLCQKPVGEVDPHSSPCSAVLFVSYLFLTLYFGASFEATFVP